MLVMMPPRKTAKPVATKKTTTKRKPAAKKPAAKKPTPKPYKPFFDGMEQQLGLSLGALKKYQASVCPIVCNEWISRVADGGVVEDNRDAMGGLAEEIVGAICNHDENDGREFVSSLSDTYGLTDKAKTELVKEELDNGYTLSSGQICDSIEQMKEADHSDAPDFCEDVVRSLDQHIGGAKVLAAMLSDYTTAEWKDLLKESLALIPGAVASNLELRIVA